MQHSGAYFSALTYHALLELRPADEQTPTERVSAKTEQDGEFEAVSAEQEQGGRPKFSLDEFARTVDIPY